MPVPRMPVPDSQRDRREARNEAYRELVAEWNSLAREVERIAVDPALPLGVRLVRIQPLFTRIMRIQETILYMPM